MSNEEQNDDRDLEIILKEKLSESINVLKEHEEKLKFHLSQMDFHKKRVEYIEKVIQPKQIENE